VSVCVVVRLDVINHVARHGSVVQQRLFDSPTHFYVSATDADDGEFCADFAADDCHYLADCADNAVCCSDHYDDNYQVVNHHVFFTKVLSMLTLTAVCIMVMPYMMYNTSRVNIEKKRHRTDENVTVH